MDISLGFIIVVTFILLPGLLFRRLYFYGDFSKQFNAGHSIADQIIIAVVPGVSIFIIVFFIYHYFFTQIELEIIINRLKEINNPSPIHIETATSLVQLFIKTSGPFIAFLYLTSGILGLISGRFIRITKLDRRFKLLRFKNYWFYILNGENFDFQKFKQLKQKKKNHLFTKADILIEQNSETALFSGIVVDYELSNSDGITLSKLYLQNAQRYKFKEGEKKSTPIPGDIFVVDCENMKNINLSYIYEDQKETTTNILRSKIPGIIELIYGLLFIAIIPILVFKVESIKFDFYESIFQLSWYNRIAAYLFIIQLLSLLNPFIKKDDDYKFVTLKLVLIKITIAFLFYCLTFFNLQTLQQLLSKLSIS